MENNLPKTKEEIEKIYGCLSSLGNNEIAKNISEMDEPKANEITKKYKITPSEKKQIKQYPSHRLCFFSFFLALFFFIVSFCIISSSLFSFIIYIKNYSPGLYANKAYERYNNIKNVSGEYLSIIYNNKSLINNTNFIDLFHLSFFKFADFAYQQNISKENFMNWKIINKFSLPEYNYFYVLEDEINKKIIVTFPGTIGGLQLLEEVLGSSLQNFNESQKEILICDYFGRRTLKIIDYIFNEKVKKLIDNGYQILATGHSLWGAMAQTFMYFALNQKRITKNNSPMIITFCQPRVGNIFFADYIDKNAFALRFINGEDIVPGIPKFSYCIYSFFKYIIRYDLNNCQYKHTNEEKNMFPDKGISLGEFFISFLYLLFIFAAFAISFIYTISFLEKECYSLKYDFGMIKYFYKNLDNNIIAIIIFVIIIGVIIYYLFNIFWIMIAWKAIMTLIVLIIILSIILNEIFNTIIAFSYFIIDFFPFIMETLDIFVYNCYAKFYNFFWLNIKLTYNLNCLKVEQRLECLSALTFLSAAPSFKKELQNLYKDAYVRHIKSHSESPLRENIENNEQDVTELLKEYERKKKYYLNNLGKEKYV